MKPWQGGNPSSSPSTDVGAGQGRAQPSSAPKGSDSLLLPCAESLPVRRGGHSADLDSRAFLLQRSVGPARSCGQAPARRGSPSAPGGGGGAALLLPPAPSPAAGRAAGAASLTQPGVGRGLGRGLASGHQHHRARTAQPQPEAAEKTQPQPCCCGGLTAFRHPGRARPGRQTALTYFSFKWLLGSCQWECPAAAEPGPALEEGLELVSGAAGAAPICSVSVFPCSSSMTSPGTCVSSRSWRSWTCSVTASGTV